MNSVIIYLWGIIDSINIVFMALSIICLIMLAIFFVFGIVDYCDKSKEEIEEMLKSYKEMLGLFKFKKIATVGIISMFMFMILPNKETIALMYIVPKIMNNEKLSKDFEDIYNLSIEKLKVGLEKKVESTVNE